MLAEFKGSRPLGEQIIEGARRTRNLAIDIRPYQGQTSEPIVVGSLAREGRINQVEPDLWIVGNDHLSYSTDVEFTREVARMMADELRGFDADIILTAASKPLAMAYEIAKLLGHEYVAVARKNIDPKPPESFEVQTRSITSGRPEKRMIDGETIALLKGKKVILFDDTISTCDTMLGLKKLAEMAGAEVVVISAVWLEGAAPYRLFWNEFQEGRLVNLATFPLFAQGEVLKGLMEEKRQVEEMFRM